MAAHRRCGLPLETSIQEGVWTTLVVRRPLRAAVTRPRSQ
jgi:hypothetical protein